MKCPGPSLNAVRIGLFIAVLAPRVAADRPVVPLWPNGAPGSEAKRGEREIITLRQEPGGSFGILYNIHNPSVTVFLPPPSLNTGASVVIAPGGAHRFLSIDHEGYDVAKWLSQRGISGFVLKYRLAHDNAGGSNYQVRIHALADAQRAIRLVRSRSGEWRVNPARVGILGFSAGGEVASLAGTRFDPGRPAAADPVERFSCRPDFVALGYGGFPDELTIAAGQPPVFLFCAYDDGQSANVAALFLKYWSAGVPAEMHIFRRGGHGFGIRDRPIPVSSWPSLFQQWLGDLGFLGRDRAN